MVKQAKKLNTSFLVMIYIVFSTPYGFSSTPNRKFTEKQPDSHTGPILPLVIGGMTASNFPQVFSIGQKTSTLCSAMLIGPKTVISAAHCSKVMKDHYGKTAKVYIHPRYKGEANGKWNIDESYGLNVLFDVSVAILKKEIKEFMPLTITRNSPAHDELVVIIGTGQPHLNVPQWGVMRTLFASLFGVTLREDNNNVTGNFGDSGGGAFLLNQDNEITLFGVLSTSTLEADITSTFPIFGKPYTTGVAKILEGDIPKGNTFLEQIIVSKKLEVCGINTQCNPITMDSLRN